jgi:hypothetical protein
MFAATYRLLLVILFGLLRYQNFWLDTRACHHGFLVNSEPLQCDCLPQIARHPPPFGHV